MQADIIKDMRKRCRMAMNGIASTSMREMGLTYKLNFGLMIQQIKDVAQRYEANAELAQQLWKEGTRELVILATLLYPKEEFTPQVANKWVEEIPNQEIREQVCLNLFQELSFADQLAIEWANSDSIETRTTGYWLLARLLLAKKISGVLLIDYFKSVKNDIISESVFLRNAALLVAKHIGRQSKEEADAVLEVMQSYKNESDPLKKEAYDSLSFEFEFFWG